MDTIMKNTALDDKRNQIIKEAITSAFQQIKIELDRFSDEVMKLSRSSNGVSFKNESLGGEMRVLKEEKVNLGKRNNQNGTNNDDKIDAHKVFIKMSMSSFLEKYGTVTEYYEKFNSRYSEITFEQCYLVDLFICGLPLEIGGNIRMFRPKTLSDAYCTAKLQEAVYKSRIKESYDDEIEANKVRMDLGRLVYDDVRMTVNTRENVDSEFIGLKDLEFSKEGETVCSSIRSLKKEDTKNESRNFKKRDDEDCDIPHENVRLEGGKRDCVNLVMEDNRLATVQNLKVVEFEKSGEGSDLEYTDKRGVSGIGKSILKNTGHSTWDILVRYRTDNESGSDKVAMSPVTEGGDVNIDERLSLDVVDVDAIDKGQLDDAEITGQVIFSDHCPSDMVESFEVDQKGQTLHQLLTELDGFLGNTGVCMLAATNRSDDVIGSVLLRPGRLDRYLSYDGIDNVDISYIENYMWGVGMLEWPKRKTTSHVNFKFKCRLWEFDMWVWRKRKKMCDGALWVGVLIANVRCWLLVECCFLRLKIEHTTRKFMGQTDMPVIN
ncbi:chloroplast protease [Artemisia annua]|uniref:Chloroplast protease n=1 Tax=Artemisia annua TaxID=35608 RepID=A0A2U1MTU7_ARTAN|nr:chloroplast protease [Artemisia annua]